MKKQYTAPKSENVQLDPLMVTFDTAAASAGLSLTPGGTIPGGGGITPQTVLTE